MHPLTQVLSVAEQFIIPLESYALIKDACTPRNVLNLIDGYRRIIDRTNLMLQSDVPEYLTRVGDLKLLLNGRLLPQLDFSQPLDNELWIKYLRGLTTASAMMIYGQIDAKRAAHGKDPDYTNDEKIISTSAPTSGKAMLCAVIAHVIEQSMFVALSGSWKKDEIIGALEYVCVLMHLENSADHAIAEIYRIATTPPSVPEGGIGWLSAERVQQLRQGYESHMREA